MKVGGKFYQAHVRQNRMTYSKWMNRQALRAQEAAIQQYGQALFTVNVQNGQESVRLTMVQTAGRLQQEMEKRFGSLDQLKSALDALTGGDDGPGVDMRV